MSTSGAPVAPVVYSASYLPTLEALVVSVAVSFALESSYMRYRNKAYSRSSLLVADHSLSQMSSFYMKQSRDHWVVRALVHVMAVGVVTKVALTFAWVMTIVHAVMSQGHYIPLRPSVLVILVNFTMISVCGIAMLLFLVRVWPLAKNKYARVISVILMVIAAGFFWAWAVSWAVERVHPGRFSLDNKDMVFTVGAWTAMFSVLTLSSALIQRLWMTRKAFQSESVTNMSALMSDGLLTAGITVCIDIVLIVSTMIPQTSISTSVRYVCIVIFPQAIALSIVWSMNNRPDLPVLNVPVLPVNLGAKGTGIPDKAAVFPTPDLLHLWEKREEEGKK
ncbi:hypothetical protein MNV49_006430 [Pseudohyphozyma bogoriensis]|nr:hypothetical protein MNV49_006430 [Pseudohyphozyma bogoriensis]